MKVEIRGRGIQIDDALREHARRRVDFALGRFESSIRWVSLQLEDMNGPRGGVDKRCVIEVGSDVFETRIVDARDADVSAVVSAACSIMARSVARALERSRGDAGGRGSAGSTY